MDCLDITQTGRRSALSTLAALSPAFVVLPVIVLMLTLYSASAWAQVTITAGDIVVVDPNAAGGNGAVIRINPSNGAQTIISSGQSFHEPVGIAIEANGTIVVTDRGFAATDVPAVIRVDPRVANGSNQTIVASGAPFIDPFGITIGAAGIIYVTDTGCAAHAVNCPNGTLNAKVYSVNPTTGAVALVSAGGLLSSPFGIEAEDAGTLVVSDATSGTTATTKGAIIRINPAGGTQTLVHAGTPGTDPNASDGCPMGITVRPVTAEILTSVFDPAPFPPLGCSPGAIWSANAVTGANTAFSPHSSVPWLAPFGMKVDTNSTVANTLLVIDESYKALFRVSTTGAVLSNFSCPQNCGFFVNPTDVDVYTTLNTPPPLGGADLSVTKDDGVTAVTAGDGVTYTYTITVTNNSTTIPATGVTLNDTWPVGFNRTSTSASCTPSAGNGNFTCSLGTIAPNTSTSVTASYTVPSTTTGSQTNTVTVSSTTSDPNTANNTASDTNTVNTSADLLVKKDDGVPTVTAGDGITRTYTITVTNNGPSQAASVMVNDTWPSGFNRTGTSASCNPPTGNGDFTCNLGTLAAGASTTVTASYTVPSTTTGSQTNTVTVSSTTPDPNTNNNTASDTNTVNTSADLSVVKSDGVNTVTAGDGITRTYTIVVTNRGPSQATGVMLTDTWPGGFIRGTTTVTPSSQGTCPSGTGSFTCSLGTLASGASVTITANYTVPSTTLPGDQTNTVSVSSSATDPTPGNNSASDTTTVVTSADLSITKTDGVTTVTAGDGIKRTYTITVSNGGPSQAASVMVNDTWPTGFNRTSLSCTPTSGTSTGNGNFTCSLGNLDKGASATVTASYTVPASTPAGTQTNTASVNSNTSDPNANNNSASDMNTVNAAPPPATSADLMISKADRPDPVATNATLVYTLTIGNNGPNAAVNVKVTDTLPATVTYQSASGSGWNCTKSGQTVTCTRSSLNAGATSTITITVTAPSQPGTIVNTASVSSDTFDPTPGNNSDSETTTVIQQVTPAKWTGAGKIKVNGGFASFAFTVKKKKNGVVQGQLDFDNLATRLDVDSISINTLTVSGNTATFTGTVRERVRNGQWSGPYNFTVTVQDNGDPGKGRDTFQIQINDPFNTTESGMLTQGNIENSGFDSRDDRDDRE